MADQEYEEAEFDDFYHQWLEENGYIFEDSEHSDREETHSNSDDDRDMAPVALIGSLTPFTPDQESFGDFISRFEEFCDLNEDFMGDDDVRRERKTKLLLLNHLPVEVRSTLSRLTGQNQPKTRPLEELKTKLMNHFNPPMLALNAVRRFQKLAQTPTESVNDFVLKLRSVAKDCDYEADLDKKLHTQLSLGLKSDRAVDQISLQGLYDPVTNNFDTASAIAATQETLEAQRLERRTDREELFNQVNKTARGRFKSQLQQPSTNSGRGFSRGNGQSFRGGRGDFNNNYQRGGRGDFRGSFNNQNNQHQNNTGTSNMPFNRGGSHRGSRGGNPGRNQGIACWRCGRQGCNPDRCWAKNAQCYQCNGFGHAKYYHRSNVNALVQNNNSGPKANPQMNQELGPDEQEAANFVSNFEVETVFVNKVMTAQEVPFEEINLEDNPDGFEEFTKMYDEEKYQLLQEASKVEEIVQEEIRSNSVEVVQEENKPKEISLVNPVLEEYVKKKEEKKIKFQQVEDKLSEALHEGKQVYFVGINAITKQPAHIVEIWMNGKKLKMEADTGSGVTLIAETLFRRLFPELQLKSSNVFLTTLSAPLTVIGAAEVNVPDAKGQLLKLRLLVCKATLEFHPLLGRDWMDVLIPNWRERFQIEQNPGLVQVVKVELPEEIQKMVQKYPEVFSEDRSKSIAGFEAKIVVKPNPKFVCHKDYDLPYSARSIVSDQLRQEVQEGRLIHVEKSEAGVASPLWPIPKSNGQYRLCVDYKRTLNPNLVIDYYPLPKPDLRRSI